MFPVAGRKVIDACRIFHQRERRDLTAAYKFYCGLDHEGAHGAAADVLATAAILDAQVVRYDDLPRTVDGLHDHCNDPDALDMSGMFGQGRGRRDRLRQGEVQGPVAVRHRRLEAGLPGVDAARGLLRRHEGHRRRGPGAVGGAVLMAAWARMVAGGVIRRFASRRMARPQSRLRPPRARTWT